MTSAPAVTIAVPTRNRAGLLRETLESALRQTCADFEVVVSDNASGDSTPELLAGLSDTRLRVFRQDKLLSMHENWNFCLAKARGRYFLLLSDDDLLLPGALDALLPAFKDPEVKLAYSRAELMTHDGRTTGLTLPAPEFEYGPAFIGASLRGRRQVLPCITLHYTAELLALGGYPEIGNVTDLAVRLALAAPGKVYCSATPLARYRLNPAGLTADAGKTIESLELFSRWFDAQPEPLSAWRSLAREFCAGWLRERAVSSALRGDIDSAARFSSAVGAYGGSVLAARALAAFCSLPPVRALAGLRRRLKAGEAS